MISMLNQLKFGVSGLLLLSIFVSSPLPAAAQTQFQPRTVEEMIAYLQGMIATLETQVRTGQGTSGSSLYSSPRGIAETLSPQSVFRDGAYLRGQVNVSQSQSVTVWFEYGRGIVSELETPRQRYNNLRQYVYEYDLDDLRTNTTYSYRFVVELNNGQRYYGQTRTFTTGNNSTSGSTSRTSLRIDRSSYDAGDTIEITIPNRSDLENNAWVGIYETRSSDTNYLSWEYVSRDSVVDLRVPGNRGTYEVRLFRDGGYSRVATSPSFTVR